VNAMPLRKLTSHVSTLIILVLTSPLVIADDEYLTYQNECLGCHVGSKNHEYDTGPPLGGLTEQYILRQLEGFKYGRRGIAHPAARTMSQAISGYSDEELREIARWASNIKGERHFDYTLGKGSKGYELYREKCKGCHEGAIGRRMTDSPKLRNLDVDYIVRQLHFFEEQLREFDEPTKHQLKMQTVVQSLTEEEYEALSRFILGASLDRRDDSSE